MYFIFSLPPPKKKTKYAHLRVHPTILTTIDKFTVYYFILFSLISCNHREISRSKQGESQRWCKAKCYQSIVTDATRFPFIRLLRGSSETAPSSLNADAESTGLMIGILDGLRIAAFPDRRPRRRVASLSPLSGTVTLVAVLY